MCLPQPIVVYIRLMSRKTAVIKPRLVNKLSTIQNNKKRKKYTLWLLRRWMHKGSTHKDLGEYNLFFHL